MNGSFTNVESRYLTPEERQHYLEIGLCAPVDAADLERIIERGGWHDQIEDLQGSLESLKDEHAETVEDLEDLQGSLESLKDEHAETVEDLEELQLKVKRCVEFVKEARGLTVDMMRVRVTELLG